MKNQNEENQILSHEDESHLFSKDNSINISGDSYENINANKENYLKNINENNNIVNIKQNNAIKREINNTNIENTEVKFKNFVQQNHNKNYGPAYGHKFNHFHSHGQYNPHFHQHQHNFSNPRYLIYFIYGYIKLLNHNIMFIFSGYTES